MKSNNFRDIVNLVNEKASSYRIGNLQQIRKEIKGLSKPRTYDIFSSTTIFDKFAFHDGGRTELQFNIGIEENNHIRYGIAFSLETTQTLPDINILIPNISRFNEFIRLYSEDFSDFIMFYYQNSLRSDDYPPAPILEHLIKPKTFIFFGQKLPISEVDVDDILDTFDKLLPIYEFVENPSKSFPELTEKSNKLSFEPGVRTKKYSTKITYTNKILNSELRHNEIQHSFHQYLINQYGNDNVAIECRNGSGAQVDVVVVSNDEYWFYEIKTYSSSRACIREGLSQLLDYSYWPGSTKASKLYIVSEAKVDNDAKEYIKLLRDNFSIPIYYIQYSTEKNKMIAEI